MVNENNIKDLDAKLLAQMLQDFLEESQEHLDQLNLDLTKLEENPEHEELINEIFRLSHTLKGLASFVGLDNFREVSHQMEDVFGAVRNGTLKVTPELIDIMFQALEVLTILRDKAITKEPLDVDISWIVQKLVAALEKDTIDYVTHPKKAASIQGHIIQSPKKSVPIQQTPVETPTANKTVLSSETIRVPTGRLDSLVDLVGELIAARIRLNEFSDRLKSDELITIASTVNYLINQMHSNIMNLRTVPIDRLFIKFPGVARNLARKNNKEVELILEGKETELDKTVIEQIYDPLIHLLRNSIDHGIEEPEEREKMGKPRLGRIILSAWHQGDTIIIEVSDDGRGIDPIEIKEIALKQFIITKEEAHKMSDREAIRLIFAPGFSTAKEVTDVSGRGVGTDVVLENVKKLRGIVDVHSVVGKGTTFRIQIPLTLAILQVLLVNAGGLIYALPIHTLSETLVIHASEVQTMGKNEVVFIRGEPYPLKSLSSLLKCGSTIPPKNDLVPVVVVGLAEKKVALAVDELLGKQEVVMKSVGKYLGKITGIEGAAILADGSITLIVDIETALD